LKRFHLALADGTSYHQIEYNYENDTKANEAAQPPTVSNEPEAVKDCYKIPSGLTLPEGITLVNVF
jgi:hypothetical protein